MTKKNHSQGKVENYHAKMRMLMKALAGRNYEPSHKWSPRQLKSITPDKIARYINERVYGDAEARPDGIRKSTSNATLS